MIVLLAASGIPWVNRPGERLDPTASITSLLCRNSAGLSPLTPTNSGWFSGKAPFAFSVVITGAFNDSANAFNSAEAPAYITPSPA